MLRRIQIFILILIAGQTFYSCKDSIQGNPVENMPPQTYTVVDTIIRSGDLRLKTQIDISWWGDDPDGYVVGYEISFDKQNWTYTTSSDSSFLFEIPGGIDTFDFSFYVRSIDNAGGKDLSPARLIYPVKNSPPSIKFIYATTNPVRKPEKTFPAIKFNWQASDPDGFENIGYYELYINDTNRSPVIIDPVYSSALFIADKDSFSNDLLSCKLLLGSSLTEHDQRIWGLKLNDSNVFYIRAVDIVGEKSLFAGSYKLFVRKPESNILLVNAYDKSISTNEQFYQTHLNNIGISNFQITRIKEVNPETNTYTELAPDNITQSYIFDFFDAIIWFGKDVAYSLSLAQRSLGDFLAGDGKVFMAVEISSSIDQQAGYLDFTPIDSLVNLPKGVNGFRIERDSILPALAGWPLLKASKFISSARPFYQNVNSVSLYDAKIVKTGSFGKAPWEGKSTVIASHKRNGKTNFIISSLELQNLDGLGTMDDLFQKIFIGELEL